jgi:hypothetical protein
MIGQAQNKPLMFSRQIVKIPGALLISLRRKLFILLLFLSVKILQSANLQNFEYHQTIWEPYFYTSKKGCQRQASNEAERWKPNQFQRSESRFRSHDLLYVPFVSVKGALRNLDSERWNLFGFHLSASFDACLRQAFLLYIICCITVSVRAWSLFPLAHSLC